MQVDGARMSGHIGNSDVVPLLFRLAEQFDFGGGAIDAFHAWRFRVMVTKLDESTPESILQRTDPASGSAVLGQNEIDGAPCCFAACGPCHRVIRGCSWSKKEEEKKRKLNGRFP